MIKKKIYQGKLNFKLIDFTCLIQISAVPKRNKAGYTAISCARLGRGSNAQKSLSKKNGGPMDRPTDRLTDGRTDGRTDTPSYRVAVRN